MTEVLKRLKGKIMPRDSKLFGSEKKRPSSAIAVLTAMFVVITLSLLALAVSAVHQSFTASAVARCV